MKCLACYGEFDDDLSECPLCGFPVFAFIGDSPEEMEFAKKQAEEYRLEKLAFAVVGVTAHCYEPQDNIPRYHHDEDIEIADLRYVEPGKIFWMKEEFTMPDTTQSWPIHYYLRLMDGSVVRRMVSLVPKSVKNAMLGIKKEDIKHIRFVVGTDDSYNETELISVTE